MSVIFRIRPAGQLDGVTVPLIQTAVQDPATGIYDVTFNSLNSNFGVLDIQELMRVGLGNRADDFLIPQLILTDGGAATLTLSKDTYGGGSPAGINRELLWEYIDAPADIIGPKPFLNYTGQRLSVNSDSAAMGESEIYVVVYPVSSGELLDAICCTTEGDAAAAPGASCCAPQYLHQNQWDAYGFSFLSTGGVFSLDLDASVCGQPPGNPGILTAAVRPSFFGGPAGTPPAVVSAEVDPVNNIARITLDATPSTDGRYVLELTNDCGCCFLFPLEGVSL
jgi:hypothetical protein